jgi:hypothetical protein
MNRPAVDAAGRSPHRRLCKCGITGVSVCEASSVALRDELVLIFHLCTRGNGKLFAIIRNRERQDAWTFHKTLRAAPVTLCEGSSPVDGQVIADASGLR